MKKAKFISVDERQLIRRGLKVLAPIFNDIPLRLIVQNPKTKSHVGVSTEGFEDTDDSLASTEEIEDPWFSITYIVNKKIKTVKRQAAYFKVVEDKLVLFSIMNRQIASFNMWTDIKEERLNPDD